MKKRKSKKIPFICFLLLLFGYILKIAIPFYKEKIKTVKVDIVCEPYTLDSRKAATAQEIAVVKMYMEGLTRIEFDNHPIPSLAEKICLSCDKLIYTVTLRKAFWSNGDKVQSSDFVYAWITALEPSFDSKTCELLYAIKNGRKIKEGLLDPSCLGVRVFDDKTLIIELEKPTPYFPQLLAHPIFFPVNKKSDFINPGSDYISCGPFIIKKWKKGRFIEMKKNLGYCNQKMIHIKNLSFFFSNGKDKRRDYDWQGAPFSNVGPHAFMLASFIRIHPECELFKEKKLREALAFSIQRQKLIAECFKGDEGFDSSLLLISNLSKNEKTFSSFDRKSWHEFVSIPSKSIKLSFLSTKKNELIAEFLQKEWKEALGLEIELDPLENSSYYLKVAQKDCELCLGSYVMDFREDIDFLEIFRVRDLATNTSKWESFPLLDLVEKAYLCKNPQQRMALLKKYYEAFIDEVSFIPLFYKSTSYERNTRLKNVIISDTGDIDFKWARLQKR